MLIIFFDCEGVVHYEFASRGQTINKEYYVEVLKRLRDAVRRKDRVSGQAVTGFFNMITRQRI